MVLSVLGTLLPEYNMNILKVQVALGTWSHIWGGQDELRSDPEYKRIYLHTQEKGVNMRKYEEIHTKKIFR